MTQRLGGRSLLTTIAGEAGELRAGGAAGGSDQASFGQEEAGNSGAHLTNPDASHQVQLQQAEASVKEHYAPVLVSLRESGKQQVEPAAPSQSQREPGTACSIAPSAVFLMTLLMAGASGLGALPYFFVGTLSKEWGALANALACGVMLAASFDLVHEGEPYGAMLVLLGVVLGALRALGLGQPSVAVH